MKSIRILDIRSSKLRSLSDIKISKNIKISHFDLSFGFNLESLDNAPDFLSGLVYLHMQTNKIKIIPTTFLDKIQNVKQLNLAINQIQMRENMFEKLTSLQSLVLNTNQLTKIENNWFNGLVNLQQLDIRNNLLRNFSYESLVMNTCPKLRKLRIEGNRFNCTFLKKMVDDLRALGKLKLIEKENSETNNDGIYNVYGYRCYDENENENQDDESIDKTENDEKNHDFVIVSLGIVLLILGATIIIGYRRKIIELPNVIRRRQLGRQLIQSDVVIVRKNGLDDPHQEN